MSFDPNTRLLVIAFVGVALLIFLIARCKLHAFLALLLAALFVGLTSGMKPGDIAGAFQLGVGNTLGSIAVIVGLGTMLGKLLAESGGAEVLANTFIQVFGPRRLPIAMVVIAFVVGLPVFFGVGILLLAPIIFSLCRDTKLPVLALALPMVAGLSTSHCLVPPHVGPMVAIEKLHADVGRTILYSILIGFPIAVLFGLIYTRFITRSISVEIPAALTNATPSTAAPAIPNRRRPGFAIALLTVALPILLMLGDTLAKLVLPTDSPVVPWASFFGSPAVSMFLSVLLAFQTFGRACGFDRRQILKFMEDSLGPAAGILLVVGAGGGFSKVLELAGVAKVVADQAGHLNLSPIVLGWSVAVLIRIAVGSATVTITMTAAMLAPIADANPGTNRELLVVALGAGSLIASHLNDGGFWFVKEYFNLTVAQTLRTWTVLVTLISIAALGLTLLLNRFL